MLNFIRKRPAHASDAQLLEYIDGELPETQAAELAAHIHVCSQCRIRAERYTLCQRSIHLYHHSALARLGAPPTDFEQFDRRLSRQQQEWMWRRNLPAPQRIARALQARLGTLGASYRSALRAVPAAAIVAILAYLVLRPNVEASATELLERAQAREDRAMTKVVDPVEHQHIRVRARGRQADLEIWRAQRVQRPRLLRSADEQMRTMLVDLYESNSLDPERPMAVASFMAWRNALSRHQDQVEEDAARHLVRVSTIASEAKPGRIRHIDYVLRTTDWHPVEQRIYVSRPSGEDDELDLEEISYAVVPAAEIPANLLESAAVATSAAESITAPGLVGQARLMASMVALAEAFHRIGADLREAPQVRTTGQQVEYSLWTADPARRQQILAATHAIPYVSARIEGPQVLEAHEMPLPPSKPTYATTPPLQRELWQFAGGAEEAGNYLAAMSDAEHRLLSESAALDRLATQFPRQQVDQLPYDLQRAIRQIAADHLHAIHADASEYFSLLNPLLDTMLRRENVADAGNRRTHVCSNWQALAPQLHKNIPLLHMTIERAFLEDHADSPAEDLSTQTLLNQAVDLRARVREDLPQSCDADGISLTNAVNPQKEEVTK